MEMPSEEKVSRSTEVLYTAKVVVEQADSETTVTEQLPNTITSVEPDCPHPATIVPELHGATEGNAISSDEGVTCNISASEVSQPLNFDNINSAAELEVLGMEKLKSELQARGLKCGGTLQERAARLFLLKTTPLEKLPNKLFDKK